jgi:glycosyltransferase involved in cell wall biosynthesis
MGFYFIQAFRRAGVKVTAVSPPKPSIDFGGSTEFASVVDELHQSHFEVDCIAGLERLASPRALKELIGCLRKRAASHVVSIHQNSLKYAAAAARLCGIRHISARQGPVTMYGSQPIRSLKSQIFRQFLLRGTHLAICTNPLDEQQLVSEYHYPPERVRVLPNGIDLACFPTSSLSERFRLRQQLGVAEDELLLINVGRLDPQKDQLTLLRAFREAQPLSRRAKLVLVGNVTAIGTEQAQRYADSLHTFAREAGIGERVVFAGWRNDVAALLQASDIYVHSAAWEGFPLVMCEAMAARLPFIGTDCFGVPEGFIQGEHGRFVPKQNPSALAAAVRAVLEMPSDARRQLGENGRRLIEERYDVRRIADRFVGLTLSA